MKDADISNESLFSAYSVDMIGNIVAQPKLPINKAPLHYLFHRYLKKMLWTLNNFLTTQQGNCVDSVPINLAFHIEWFYALINSCTRMICCIWGDKKLSTLFSFAWISIEWWEEYDCVTPAVPSLNFALFMNL